MVKIFPSCRLQGDGFSPVNAEKHTGLRLEVKQEPGEIAVRGRFAGRPAPFGSAVLRGDPKNREDATSEEVFLRLLDAHIDSFRAVGATDIVIHLDVEYDTQCNLEFEPEFIAALHRIGLPVRVTCYASCSGPDA